MKLCPSCQIEKEESEFSKDSNAKDGKFSICRSCVHDRYVQFRDAGKVPESREKRWGHRICIKCSKDYIPSTAKQKYCSVACSAPATKACASCGKEFHNSHYSRRYCSYECYKESKIGKEDITANGYVRRKVPLDTPGVNPDGRMMLHRYIMQKHLGRPLKDSEQVHHINGNKLDNRLENLQLRIGVHGKGIVMRCFDCGSQNVHPVEIASLEG
jgi:hypothetical protein